MSEHVSDDRLIDLATGLVPASESGTMLSHLRGCPACEETFRGLCRDVERTKLRTAPPKRRVAAVGAAAALAAAVLVAAALVPSWRSSRAVDPAAYWVPIEAEAVDLRAGIQDVDSAIFTEATDAYRKHDAQRVVRLLGGREIPESQDPLRLLYASALLKTGDAAGTLAALEPLRIPSLPQPYRDRAKWVKLAALRALSRDDDARSLAAELSARPGEFADAARRLGEMR
jgi:hypothetical protein